MSDGTLWEVNETTSSMPFRDQREHLIHMVSLCNANPDLNAVLHQHLTPLDGMRSKKRDFQNIADKITPLLKKYGFVHWKWAKETYNLKSANDLVRIMGRIPEAIRCKKAHIEGGKHWYYHKDEDPTRWMGVHQGEAIDMRTDPKGAVEVFVKLYQNDTSINWHKSVLASKSTFAIASIKGNSVNQFLSDWNSRFLQPRMEQIGFRKKNSKVYTKEE